MGRGESASKKTITREEWEGKLAQVKVRKEDMNKLVMNFLLTEGYVEAARTFERESGTSRGHPLPRDPVPRITPRCGIQARDQGLTAAPLPLPRAASS
mmetsp:Transcript_29238/g.93532  ORF Transcript_29238/g.93532 Transcript_29238/m.93532 type:complete len:98 (+) Transcript_29238:182-475(+)